MVRLFQSLIITKEVFRGHVILPTSFSFTICTVLKNTKKKKGNLLPYLSDNASVPYCTKGKMFIQTVVSVTFI